MEDQGVSSTKLKKIDLLNIAISVNLAPVEDLKKMDKDTLLSLVQEWEAKKIAEAEAKDLAKESLVDTMGSFAGKKVVKVVDKVINDKDYKELTTEDGATYLVLVVK